jgi:hypothetical protein
VFVKEGAKLEIRVQFSVRYFLTWTFSNEIMIIFPINSKNSTLNTALGVKSRANVMQEILNKGSKMVASEPLSAQKHFDVIKCAFLELARKK